MELLDHISKIKGSIIVVRIWMIIILTMFLFLPSRPVYCGQENDKNQEPKAKPIKFLDHIRPIFKNKCFHCHSSKSFFLGGLRLNSLDWIKKGGHSGPSITANQPQKSILFQFIKSGRMPPNGNEQLNQKEINLIENWIKQGAK